MHSVFTVYHDGQFWVAVYEQYAEGAVRTARHVFGGEPSNAELAAFAVGPGFAELMRRAERAPAVPAVARLRKLRKAAGKEWYSVGRDWG